MHSQWRKVFYVRVTRDYKGLTVNVTHNTQVITLPPGCLSPDTWHAVSISKKKKSMEVHIDGELLMREPTQVYLPNISSMVIRVEEGGLLSWCKQASHLPTEVFTTSGGLGYLWHHRNRHRASIPKPRYSPLTKLYSEPTPPPLPPPFHPPQIILRPPSSPPAVHPEPHKLLKPPTPQPIIQPPCGL
ncbi:uncharacterized protein LOC121855865 [Homarus americanus]|uniref:Laminin G domain-containing protein n=1 Tax=Homarus americanus TaxID=6706 RepID=A0A8J5JDZ8_HOMAM|nr:uncharacterized protein LOC121855865 [Homarus americanus]KAG7154758.1 hypothetical protein Hamer_G025838 [Homarus americanus]